MSQSTLLKNTFKLSRVTHRAQFQNPPIDMSSSHDAAPPAKRKQSAFTAADYMRQLEDSRGLAVRDTHIHLPGTVETSPTDAEVAELQRLVSDPTFLAKHDLLSCTAARDEELGQMTACARYKKGVYRATARRCREYMLEDFFASCREDLAKKTRFGLTLPENLRVGDVKKAAPMYAPDHHVEGFYSARSEREFVLFEPKGDATSRSGN